ncbi:MAG: ABC transporter ATP-binding protein [Micrococcales bacterium]|nr:ABC transporter ATP-binding protein [Micrococcales bacterium]
MQHRPGPGVATGRSSVASSLVRLVDVHRTFGAGTAAVHALRGVSLDLLAGELTVIMGASGSGKSTLLSIAGTLDRPDDGQVIVADADVAGYSLHRLAALRRTVIGYVFQEINLLPSLTAAENVAMPLELDGMSARAARQAALVQLERVGVVEQADKFPDEMSGGQAQRVAIARALAGDRQVVLADEPTGALDTASGDGIVAVLRRVADDGCAVGVVTHEPRLAGWADRVVRLSDGLIVEQTRIGHPQRPPTEPPAAADEGLR